MAVYVPGASLFDPTAYLARNADVASAAGSLTGQARADFAFTHFLTWGAAEGRDPLGEVPTATAAPGKSALTTTLTAGTISGDVGGTGAASGGLFDATFYLATYADVQAAAQKAANALTASGQTVPSNFLAAFALEHFVQYGAVEGRAPSGYFNPLAYLASAPDVNLAVAAGATTAVQQYLQFGQTETRAAPAVPITLQASTRAQLAALSNTTTRPVILDLVNTGGLDPISAADLQNIHNLTALRFDGTAATSLALTDALLQSILPAGTKSLVISVNDPNVPNLDLSGVGSQFSLSVGASSGIDLASIASHTTGGSNVLVNGVPLSPPPSPPPPPPSGQTFVGTSGNDNFVGTSGNDVFQFSSTALSTNDTVTGGGGTDTLELLSASQNVTAAALMHVTGISTIQVDGASGTTVRLTDALLASGLGVGGNITLAAHGSVSLFLAETTPPTTGHTVTLIDDTAGQTGTFMPVNAALNVVIGAGAGSVALGGGSNAVGHTITVADGARGFVFTPASSTGNSITDNDTVANSLVIAPGAGTETVTLATGHGAAELQFKGPLQSQGAYTVTGFVSGTDFFTHEIALTHAAGTTQSRAVGASAADLTSQSLTSAHWANTAGTNGLLYDIAGSGTTATAAAASANATTIGDPGNGGTGNALWTFHDGTTTELYLFTYDGSSTTVVTGELTLIAVLNNVTSLATGDIH